MAKWWSTLMCMNGHHGQCKGKSEYSGKLCLCDCHPRTWKRGYLRRKADQR